MSLTVRAVRFDERGKMISIGDATAAGFERWRADVWGSKPVIALAQTVRRPRPSRLILPSLASQDVIVQGEELEQLDREIEAIWTHADEVVREIQRTGAPMVGAILGGAPIGNVDGTPRGLEPIGPTDEEIIEHFRARLRNLKEAVALARTVAGGGVWIS